MREVPLVTPGLTALVDDEDYELVSQFSWCADRKLTTYARRSWMEAGRQRFEYMHVLILGIRTGIDHEDRNGLNNQRYNLRPYAHIRLNTGNQVARQGRFKGVCAKGTGWRAKCGEQYLGTFSAEEEAALVYDAAARLRWGEFARLNFPAEAG
jgi:hypothetical protein